MMLFRYFSKLSFIFLSSTIINSIVFSASWANIEKAALVAPTSLVDTQGGVSVIKLPAGHYIYSVNGFLHLDSVSYFGSDAQPPSGSNIRNAQFGIVGALGEHWSYNIDMIHTGIASYLLESYLGYTGFKSMLLRFGQIRRPSGLEGTMLSNNTPLMEFSLANSLFSNANQLGGLGCFILWYGKNITLEGAVTHPFMSPQSFIDPRAGRTAPLTDDPLSFGARMTFAPVHNDCVVYHSGFTYQYHNLRSKNFFNFNAQPELATRNINAITETTNSLTSNIPNDSIKNYYVLDGELAMRVGPLLLASEYYYTKVHRQENASLKGDLDFYGYYLLGSYVLTGESRTYDFLAGRFSAVKPRSKKGALELSLRHGYVKLLDSVVIQSSPTAQMNPLTPFADNTIGNAYATTVGLTWWLNANIRFMVNYSRTNYVNRIALGGAALPNKIVNAIGVRCQLNWS